MKRKKKVKRIIYGCYALTLIAFYGLILVLDGFINGEMHLIVFLVLCGLIPGVMWLLASYAEWLRWMVFGR